MGSVRAARERIEGASSDPRYSEDSMDSSQHSWPVAGNNNAFQQAQLRNVAPQRPPRPSYVPSMLGEQDNVEYGQSQQYTRNGLPQQAKYWEPNYATSTMTPTTPSSRDSAGSSVGSIPDFPVPALPTNPPQAVPRRPQNAGPPPTQRRGPSSYYSTNSLVTPIPEEAIELPQQASHPTQRSQVHSDWYDDTPSIYIDRSSTISGPGEHLVEPAGLVRNASMGRQYKPSLTTVRPANETLRQQKGHAAPQPTTVDRTHLAAEHTVFVESVESDDEETSLRGRDSMEGTTFLRETSSDSDLRKDALLGEKEILVSPLYSRDSSPTRQDHRFGLEKGNTIPPPLAPQSRPKPAAFDFAAEASNRASLTSLSDLIRRATKVKTNLEKGRTASRLGLRDFFTASKSDLLKAPKDEPPRESFTDMLEAFPPPALTTPNQDEMRNETARWSLPFANTAKALPRTKEEPIRRRNPKGRRCCGIPILGFVFLLFLLIILVAAAVLVPVFLIVIPNQNKANAACPNSFPCSNGGYSISASDGCRCICAGGFTGSQCGQAALVASDCTTANLDGFNQATVGSKVLPLLQGASNYSIPLNNTILLSDFSVNKLYCGDENNLITFLNTGSNGKRAIEPPTPTAPAALHIRGADGNANIQASPTLTGGLVLDSSTPTATSAGPAATASNPSAAQLGFAQTAILYILQQDTLDNAKTGRNNLDKAFQNGNWMWPVVVTPNITVDLRLSKVKVGATTVGMSS